jgi:hypothetical protein
MTRQVLRKLAGNLSILILLSACLFFVSSPKAAWGSAFFWQTPKKSITKYEHRKMPLRFGKVRAAGKLLELKAGPESRESQESREEFDADDDWMKGLAVNFTNTSDKAIVYFRLLLIFPETESAGPPMAFPMIFGRRPKDAEDRNFDNVLKPGEEAEVALNEDQYGKLQNFLKSSSFDKVTSVRLFLEEVAFDDDLMWMGGDLWKRDPNDANQWLPIR